MIINELNPKIEFSEEFDFSKFKRIPKQTGCYVISNFDYQILYIGKAKNLQNRYVQHLNSTEKTSLTKYGKAYWFSYSLRNDEFEISKLERGWLNHYELKNGELPILNRIHAG